MSIKNNKPTHKSGFKQGYYNPTYPEKYSGEKPIIYRSSWELKWMKWCDHNEKILKWGSETVKIPYISKLDGKSHTYYPDGVMLVETEEGNTKKFLVEIKPKNQLVKPNPPKKNSKKAFESYQWTAKEYIKNMSKYEYAKEWCRKRGFKFIIMTEDILG